MISYRCSAIGCLCLSLIILITACAAPQVPAASERAAGAEGGNNAPVRIGFGASEFERAVYQPLIDAFNAANSDMQVQFVPLEPNFASGRSSAEVVQAIAGQADTFSSLLVTNDVLSNGALTDLRPLIAADPSFDAADYQPGALAGAADGGVYLLPHTLNLQLLGYNREVWEAAGLSEPPDDWRWDDLLAAAEQLTRRTGAEVQTYGIDDGRDGMVILLGLLAEAGLGLNVDANGQVHLDLPEVAAAVERVADLIDRGVIYQRPQNAGAVSFDAIGAHIREGRTALWLGGPALLGEAFGAAEPEFTVGTATLPTLPAGDLASRRGYVMSSGTANPELAWRWLAYLSRQTPGNGALMVFGNGYDVPARESLALETGFWAEQPVDRAAALRAALDDLAGAPVAGGPLVYGNLLAALSAVRSGTPTAVALADAQANLDTQLLAQADAPPEERPVVQLPAAAPVAPAGAQTIRFGAFSNLNELRALADAFNAQNNGVFVELEPPAFDGEFSLRSMAERYDCLAWLTPPKRDDFAALTDLQPLFDADPSFAQSDYPAGLLAPLRDGPRLYGLPYAVDLRTLRYNIDAFSAAGLPAPSADWDLADLLEAAARLHDPEGNPPRYGYGVEGIGINDLRGFLAWQGANLADSAGAPQLTTPEVIAVAQQYIDLLRTYSPQTRIEGYGDGGFVGASGALIAQGQVGFWFSYGMSGGGLVFSFGGGTTPAPEVGIAPPPAGSGGLSASDFAATSLLISAESADPAACWEWLKFLSAQTGGLGNSFPARTSVAESAEFLAQARPGAAEVYTAYRAALNAPAPPATEPQFDPFWFYQAVDRALQGADLERELAQAQDLSEQHYACVVGGEDTAACAQLIDPQR